MRVGYDIRATAVEIPTRELTALLFQDESPPLRLITTAQTYAMMRVIDQSFSEGERFMLYLLAIILPPVAVLLSGKPGQALLNLILTLCLWIPGVIHAIMVVNEHKADKRAERLARQMRG